MFTPLNEIERLLIAAATDVDARGVFLRAILDADLYISPAGEPPEGGGAWSIITSKLPTGEQAAAVFTAPERLHAVVGAGAAMAKFNGRALFEIVGQGPVHLNPNLAPSVIWSAGDVQEILTGVRQVTAKAGGQVMLAHPAQRPEALIAALSRGLGAVPAVRGAWLLLSHRSGEAEQNWMLGVEHSGPWEAMRDVIGRTLDGVDLGGRMLEATAVKDDPFGAHMRAGIPIVAPR